MKNEQTIFHRNLSILKAKCVITKYLEVPNVCPQHLNPSRACASDKIAQQEILMQKLLSQSLMINQKLRQKLLPQKKSLLKQKPVFTSNYKHGYTFKLLIVSEHL